MQTIVCFGLALAVSLSAHAVAQSQAGPTDEERKALAPTGRLRIGVFPSPTSIVTDRTTGDVNGIAFEVGRALAGRLSVPFDVVQFPQITGVLDAMRKGEVDVTTANPRQELRGDFTFSAPILRIETGYLVRSGADVVTVDAVDRRGVRVGVTAGGPAHGILTGRLKLATIVPVASPGAAAGMLRAGTLDAYATNKALLSSLADDLPGARVLEGRWGIEDLALAIPKRAERGAPFVDTFAKTITADGWVNAAATRARLRGVVRE